MKYFGSITDENDIATKGYVDGVWEESTAAVAAVSGDTITCEFRVGTNYTNAQVMNTKFVFESDGVFYPLKVVKWTAIGVGANTTVKYWLDMVDPSAEIAVDDSLYTIYNFPNVDGVQSMGVWNLNND